MRILASSIATLGLVILSGCGHGAPEEVRAHPHSNLNSIAGPLGDTLRSIQKSEYAENCDSVQGDHKAELISLALNLEQELKDLPPQPHANSNVPLVKFAGSYLVNYPLEPSAGDTWAAYEYGWQGLYDHYQSHRSNPTRGLWTYLNSEARSLLLEDQRRVLDGVNDGINHENVEILGALDATLSDCLSQVDCVTLKMDPSSVEQANRIPYYHYYLLQLDRTSDPLELRKIINRFSKRVHFDAQIFQENYNSKLSVQKEDNFQHLSLSIDASQFSAPDQSLIRTIIESVWKTTGIDLTLNFTQSFPGSNFYNIIFHLDRPGERDYVSASDKTLNLFPLRGVHAIAHEFGHVLGFSDHYYTVWDADRCVYREESNNSDLMSDSENGAVTSSEWKHLLRDLNKPRS